MARLTGSRRRVGLGLGVAAGLAMLAGASELKRNFLPDIGYNINKYGAVEGIRKTTETTRYGVRRLSEAQVGDLLQKELKKQGMTGLNSGEVKRLVGIVRELSEPYTDLADTTLKARAEAMPYDVPEMFRPHEYREGSHGTFHLFDGEDLRNHAGNLGDSTGVSTLCSALNMFRSPITSSGIDGEIKNVASNLLHNESFALHDQLTSHSLILAQGARNPADLAAHNDRVKKITDDLNRCLKGARAAIDSSSDSLPTVVLAEKAPFLETPYTFDVGTHHRIRLMVALRDLLQKDRKLAAKLGIQVPSNASQRR